MLRLMRLVCAIAILAIPLVLAASALAQTQTVERSVRGPSDKDIRIGVYVNVQPDCTSGPLPSIRLSGPPANRKVAVRNVKIKATNYKQCLALQVPGYIAFYRSAPAFIGADIVTLEVKFPNGRTEIQKITVNVGTGATGQTI